MFGGVHGSWGKLSVPVPEATCLRRHAGQRSPATAAVAGAPHRGQIAEKVGSIMRISKSILRQVSFAGFAQYAWELLEECRLVGYRDSRPQRQNRFNSPRRQPSKELTNPREFVASPHSRALADKKLRARDRPLANDFVTDGEFDRLLHAWFGNIVTAVYSVACGVLPTGLVQRPFLAIASIISLQFIGLPNSPSTLAAASSALTFLTFPSGCALRPAPLAAAREASWRRQPLAKHFATSGSARNRWLIS
jgi:hypothetical protein